MYILLALLALLVIVLVVVLCTRLVLEIDTVKEVYRVSWGPAVFQLLLTEEPRWCFRAPFIRREGEVFAGRGANQEGVPSSSTQRPKPPQRKPMTAEQRRRRMRTAYRILKSFRVRTFRWRLDPGDVVLSAWLFPIFHLWRMRGPDVAIDLTGRNELHLVIDQTPLRMIMAALSE